MATGPATATQLTATVMAPVTAIRLMAMVMAPVTAIRLTGLTELTELRTTPWSDAISMPLLPVSIVIVITTNVGRVRALADLRGAYAFAVGPTPFLSVTIGGIGVTLSSCEGPTLGRAAG